MESIAVDCVMANVPFMFTYLNTFSLSFIFFFFLAFIVMLLTQKLRTQDRLEEIKDLSVSLKVVFVRSGAE